jgi:hypothetical protein
MGKATCTARHVFKRKAQRGAVALQKLMSPLRGEEALDAGDPGVARFALTLATLFHAFGVRPDRYRRRY